MRSKGEQTVQSNTETEGFGIAEISIVITLVQKFLIRDAYGWESLMLQCIKKENQIKYSS